MTPALVIGHPTTLVVSLLLIPVTLILAVLLPGNEFLPLASLAGMFYVFPLVLPYTKGNVFKTFIVGLVVIVLGLYCVTNLAQWFTLAAHDVYAATGDAAVNIPGRFRRRQSRLCRIAPGMDYFPVHRKPQVDWLGPTRSRYYGSDVVEPRTNHTQPEIND